MNDKNALILQSDTEKVLAKIYDLKRQYLTEKENLTMRKFIKLFCELAESHFGLLSEHLRELTKEELVALDDLILKKGKIRKIGVLLLEILCIPILGFGIVFLKSDFKNFDGPNMNLCYSSCRKKLIKVRGLDFFP